MKTVFAFTIKENRSQLEPNGDSVTDGLQEEQIPVQSHEYHPVSSMVKTNGAQTLHKVD